MRFDSPETLWLLLFPTVGIVFSLLKKLPAYPSRVLRLQCLVASILLLALANPVKDEIQKAGSAALVIDLSDSLYKDQIEGLYRQAKELTRELSDVVVIPFADKAKIMADSAQAFSDVQAIAARTSEIAHNRTNLEAALTLAAQSSGNVILLSDGYQNMGNVLISPEIFTSKIFPLVPQDSVSVKPKYLGLSGLDLPLMASTQKSVDIRSSIQNNTNSSQQGRLIILHDNKQVYSELLSLAAGEERLVTSASDPAQEGIKEVRAIFEPSDKSLPASSKIAYLSTDRREKILLFSGSSEDARLLQQAFDNQAYELVSVLPDQPLPNIKDYSVLILNNIAASQLPGGFPSQLSEYVRAGGSFAMIGGNRSYGLGGYVGSPVAELLPVDPQPPQAQQKRLTVAVELIIDKSRSMADNSKLEYSKEAARETVRNLKDEDFVGVIGFDSSPFEVVKLGRVGEMRAQAIERIGRLFPAQKTNLFPAMDEGRRRLEAIDAGRKHMIILTDGKIPDADQSYLELVKQMRLNGITLSTVLVGTDYDFGFLKDMSERGGGAYYQTSDPSSLPKIFIQDVKVRSGEKTMQEQKEFPVLVSSSGVRSTTIEDYPDLLGFVETKLKNGASLELLTHSQDKNFPILASWEVGKGKVIAFTSDANGRWSRPWASWTRFVPFWVDILDSLRSKNKEGPIHFDLRQHLEGDYIKINLTLFEDAKGEPIVAKISGPGGKTQSLNFIELAKGSYQAQIPADANAGRYDFSASVGNRQLTNIAFNIAPNVFKEEQGLGYNLALLEQLASQSSGKINPQSSDLSESKAVIKSSTSYRWTLLLLALVIYLFGIIWRELRLSTKSFGTIISRASGAIGRQKIANSQ